MLFFSPYSLLDIKMEVEAIEAAVLDPTFGLEEIKSEVASIESKIVDIQADLTSLMAEPAVLMEMFADTVSTSGTLHEPFYFPEVRHVSLTLGIIDMPDFAGESVYVVVHLVGTASSQRVVRILPGDQSFYTLEFDAQTVRLYLQCNNTTPVVVMYAMTTTYPR